MVLSPAFEKLVLEEPTEKNNNNHDDDDDCSSTTSDDGSEFEFEFVSNGLDYDDDLFAGGEGRHPVYPLFDRNLLDDGGLSSNLQKLSVERDESASDSNSSQNSTPVDAESYCVWSPEMRPPRLNQSGKSRSTGTSSSRRWKLMDLMVGRSRSDGKERFLFLAPPPPNTTATAAAAATGTAERKMKKKVVVKKVSTEMDMNTAHRLYYSKNAAGDRSKSSYLPYRKGLVGFRPF